jgi:primosomal protein N' (replication factor Y)
VLVLLPEIALTESFLKRFEARFGVAPVTWHSSLKSSERRRAWRAIAAARRAWWWARAPRCSCPSRGWA